MVLMICSPERLSHGRNGPYSEDSMAKTKVRSDLRSSSPRQNVPSFNGLTPPTSRPAKPEARIRALEKQNERLASFAVRVKAEIDELKRVISRLHESR